MTLASDWRDITRTHRAEMMQWTAHTGLSIYGLGGMPYLAAILFGWHHPALAQLPPLGRLLPGLGVVVWVIAIATWVLFTRHHTRAARIGLTAFVAGVTVWALGSAILADAADPRGRHLWVLAAVLALLPLCAFAPAVYQAASEPTRADTIDLTRPKLGWLITQPLYLLTAAVFYIGLFSASVDAQGLFDGNPLATAGYALAVLGGAILGVLRKRSPAPFAVLAAACSATLGIPLALAGMLIFNLTGNDPTRMLIELGLLVVLIPVLLLLGRHRLHTPTAPTPAMVSIQEHGAA